MSIQLALRFDEVPVTCPAQERYHTIAPILWPIPAEPGAIKLEIIKLRQTGWSDRTIASLLHCHMKTVRKWWRRFQQSQQHPTQTQPSLWLEALSCAPHHPARKVFIGAIHATLTLQKKYGYAGWFRIKGYLERDYGIRLSETTIKKIMRLNRRVHLAPQRPIEIIVRDPREGPPKSKHPFEHVYTDIRYLDAKPEGIQLYSTLLLEGHSRTILAGSLTPQQDVGVALHCYYLALLHWGRWEEIISDHGGQFMSHDFARVNL